MVLRGKADTVKNPILQVVCVKFDLNDYKTKNADRKLKICYTSRVDGKNIRNQYFFVCGTMLLVFAKYISFRQESF